uniref:Uncharacterized LOC107582041 n=1 Tax=Sinocyclocheilus grahami TaxID=75366 RepID=A0A672K689_SINGR
MVREDTSVTLSCFDSPPTSSVLVTWKMMSTREDRWSYLLSATCIDGQTDGRSSRVFGGRTFEISADASLIFRAAAAAQGRYSCVIEQDDKKLQERIVLLALIKCRLHNCTTTRSSCLNVFDISRYSLLLFFVVTVTPTPPVTVDSTLRLAAQVSPSSVVARGTWVSPSGEQLHTEISYGMGSLLSKLPRVTSKDNGVYTCRILVHGNSGNSVSEHRVNVTVNVKAVFSFTDVTHGDPRSLAALSRSLVTLTCPSVLGDYVLLYWEYPDSKRMELIFQFDRWRRSYTNQTKPHLHLIDPASLAAAGNFSFLLSPALKDGGLYLCEVFLDDKAFSQANRLSVLHGYTKSSRTALDLSCMYSERSQVKTVRWSYVKNPTRSLQSAAVLGRITTPVALPVTPETAGQYACTLYLKNGNSVQYMYTVTMANIDSTISPGPALPPADVSASSYVSTFSFLLFLIPLIAVAVGVLLWRQGYCVTRRSVEQSLSHHSGEVENIYENPDDLRQDLKPTGETDVYKELDR